MSKNKTSESYGPLVNEALKHRISIERMPNKKPLKVNLEESLISDIHSSSEAQIISPLIISEASSETLSDDAKTPSNLMQEDYNRARNFIEMKKEKPAYFKKSDKTELNENGIMQRTIIMGYTAHPEDESYDITLIKTAEKNVRTQVIYGEKATAIAKRTNSDGKVSIVVGSHEHGTHHVESEKDFKNLPAPLLSRVNITTALTPSTGLGLSS